MLAMQFLLACVGVVDLDGGGDNPTRTPPDSGTEDIPGTDTGDPPEDTAEDTGDEPDDYDGLYELDRVNVVEIELSEDAMRLLRRDPKEYVEGNVVVNGERYEQVGIRLKGSGSFQDLNGKSAFKVDFNRYIPEQSYHGKGKITLNNMLHDETQVHEVVAYAAFRAAGQASARVGYAWVSVNDEVYGLYSNVETPDRDYLDRNFGNRDGNLYEGGYPYYPDSYDHADFSARETRNFELESGTEVDWADVQAVTDALVSGDVDGNLEPIVDMDRYAAFQITEAWTGQWDGYAFASNNYRVYFDHGQTDKMYMVPTGLDYCFTSYGGNLATARSPLGQKCQNDPTCNERFANVLEPTLDAIDAAELEDLMDSTYAMIEPYIDEDPRNYVTTRSTAQAIETMRTWIRGRSGEVRGWYR